MLSSTRGRRGELDRGSALGGRDDRSRLSQAAPPPPFFLFNPDRVAKAYVRLSQTVIFICQH